MLINVSGESEDSYWSSKTSLLFKAYRDYHMTYKIGPSLYYCVFAVSHSLHRVDKDLISCSIYIILLEETSVTAIFFRDKLYIFYEMVV